MEDEIREFIMSAGADDVGIARAANSDGTRSTPFRHVEIGRALANIPADCIAKRSHQHRIR